MPKYNPDILTCLANLSNDEVFTPPALANKMLDSLPDAIWSDPNLKFLDCSVKTGVFLREIAKRLIKGLSKQFPDLQERINHIFTKQLYHFDCFLSTQNSKISTSKAVLYQFNKIVLLGYISKINQLLYAVSL